MPPRKKIKTEKFIAAGQTKLRYTASCIDNLLNDLPGQTFSHILPACCPLKQTKLDSSYIDRQMANKHPTQHPTHHFELHQPLFEVLPLHPAITLFCQFCRLPILSEQQVWYIELPHTRRRFTPICNACWELSPEN